MEISTTQKRLWKVTVPVTPDYVTTGQFGEYEVQYEGAEKKTYHVLSDSLISVAKSFPNADSITYEGLGRILDNGNNPE